MTKDECSFDRHPSFVVGPLIGSNIDISVGVQQLHLSMQLPVDEGNCYTLQR
jgi:hypothetical protein